MSMLEGKLQRISLILLLVVIYAAFAPPSVSAATVELSVPIRAAFDKVVAATDSSTAMKLNASYKELGTLVDEDRNREAKIRALQYNNEEALIQLRKQIRMIDSDKLAKLTAQVTQTKEKYKPLFAQYTALNKQISLVKPLKNKLLNNVLRAQADVLKITVQLARLEIKNKETSLKTAKEATALKMKNARDALSTIDPLKVQIKASRSAASLPRKSLSPVWTNFKYAIKKNDVKSTLDSLTTLVRLSRQIVDQQNKINTLETKISDIIKKTRAQVL